MFSYPCPFCSQRLLAPDDRVGQRTLCPKCLRPLVIPAPDPDDDLSGVGGPAVDPVTPVPAAAAVVLQDTTADPLTPPPAGRRPLTPPPLGRRPAGPAVPVLDLPRPARVTAPVSTRPALTDQASGRVDLNGPPLPDGLDLACQLTAALTLRMKPPPEPPTDLRLSTGAWLVLSAAAATLWVAGILYTPESLPFVAVLGGVLAAAGYVWAAYLAGRDRLVWGVLMLLVPPVAAVRLLRPFGDDGYRPLRFVLSGVVFLALAYFGPAARMLAGPVLAAWQGGPTLVAEPVGPVAKLRADRGRRPPDPLVAQLAELSRAEARKTTPAEYHGELIEEFRFLAADDRPEVRMAGLAALVVWSPDDARAALITALGSGDGPERRAALGLAGRFPDAEVARAVAARFADKDERPFAKDALVRIGGPAAESATLPLLDTDQQLLVVDVFDVLDKVGGPAAVVALRRLGDESDNPFLRAAAKQKAKVIAGRLAVRAGG